MSFRLIALALAAGSAASAATYQIDSAHSGAQFKVRHMMVSNVRGSFSNVKGTIDYDPKNIASTKVDAIIDVNTINTNELKRDAHLKSPDFFDVEKYPTITFKSKKAWKDGEKVKVLGDLTMHGVTKEITLDIDEISPEIKDPKGGAKSGASAEAKLSRKDFGLTWNRAIEAGGVAVGDDITIDLDVELNKKQ